MESDLGKLFIGGISWDTDEERLRQYFSNYGEVVEAVIMRDRATGRARGFGFVVFADPFVAERVIMDKHMIDGRPVEAKKAVPRDNQNMFRRTASPIPSSPGPVGRAKKIFVGGLPSSISESEFKNYFDQFGAITDVVVMYDHNNQRPRGFGFITFDSEEAVDRVLHKTFHELNGKMVEVKRAVPKELSPGLNRSPLLGFNNNFSLNRSSSFFNNFSPDYNLSSTRGVGRFSPIGSGRNGFSGSGNAGYGLGMNTELGLSPSYGGTSTFGNNPDYGRALNNLYFNGTSPNRYATPIGYNTARNDSAYNSNNRELWGNVGRSFNPIGSSFEVSFGNNGANWSIQSGSGDHGYSGYGRIGAADCGGVFSSFSRSNSYEGSMADLQRGGLVHGDSTWQPSSATELDGPTHSFGYELGNMGSVAATNGSEGYNGSYNG